MSAIRLLAAGMFESMSMRLFFLESLRGYATDMLALRALIIGLNFCVMIGLAAWLGLSTYGGLIFLWGLALVAATVLSAGGPLILLRDLTNGTGASRFMIARLAIFQPLILAVPAFFVLDIVWPAQPWMHILSVALAINLVVTLASVLRAQGAVGLSMALRDGGPMIALGLGAIWFEAPQAILSGATIAMILMVFLGILWSARLARPATDSVKMGRCDGGLSLWGTSVLGMLIAQMDLIVGGIFLSPEIFGLYAVLRRMANVVALPVSVATWVSAAAVSGAHDAKALQAASAAGSRIAWPPAIALVLIAVFGLCLSQFFNATALPVQMNVAFIILVGGAALQGFWASGFTVATLGQVPHYSANSRLLAVVLYGLGATIIGSDLSAVSNAFLYVFAISLSSFLLWAALRQRLGVDTSAAVLWRNKRVTWNLS